jgi:3-isopropylmalate/(R)-2-methylmalate dehydratase small subunit
MDKFTRLTGIACPLDIANLNTDQLIPARYLKVPRAQGLGGMLLRDLRCDAEGRERPDFPLNRETWRHAAIIVGARNFGCGSSREAAVYALWDYGIRCVIAPSFGDIFAGNAVQNGLLTAAVSDADASALMGMLTDRPHQPLTVDLESQTIAGGERSFGFAIDPVRRTRLLNGWDDIALTASYREEIAAFKTGDRARRPWAIPPAVAAQRKRSPEV